jgi:Ca2+-binding RTX toxin-like protein
MAQKYQFIDSLGNVTNVDTAVAGDSVAGVTSLLSVYDESGTSLMFQLDVTGDTVQQKGAGVGNLPQGTGLTDKLTATAGNDIVLWDSALLSNTTLDVPLGDRHRLQFDSQTHAIDQFDLGAGNDVLNLSYSAAVSGGLASPGAYALDATAWGNAGNDIMVGGAGADRLFGDGSSGTSAPTPGSDTMYGGAGNDVMFGDNGSTNPDESVGGNDTLFDGTGNDTLYGEGGDDSLQGASGVDTFFGGGGNDTINSGEGDDDWIYGGSGDDLLVGADTAYGGSGDDTIDGGVSLGTGIDVLYGDSGNDTLFGRNANDTLYGGTGADSIDAGSGSDSIFVATDSISASATAIVGWDGYSLTDVTITAAVGSNFTMDVIDGGSDSADPDVSDGSLGVVDTVVLEMDPNSPLNVFTYTALGSSNQTLFNVEAIVATLGADLINLTYASGSSTHLAYDQSVLINANFGNDIVFSGSGHDTIIGDASSATVAHSPGADLLYGGSGDDTIFGDFVNTDSLSMTTGGADTLFGGFGNDTLYGGAGNDTISDPDGADVYGGLGSDIISVRVLDGGAGTYTIDAGPDTGTGFGTDGNDQVIVTGLYNTIDASLGAGNDVYIGGAVTDTGETAGQFTDIVFGGAGNDVISTFGGNDTIYGGIGDDVLWGGSSNLGGGNGDVMYGGSGDDVIYMAGGGQYMAYGGTGDDTYYFGIAYRDSNAQIFETNDGSPNYLVVFGAFDDNDVADAGHPGVDFLLNGFGVNQTSHDLTNPDSGAGDPIQLTDNGDGTWTLASTFIPNSSITFDPDSITSIVLWNNDAFDTTAWPAGTPVLTFYNWNGTSYVYSDHPA